MERSIRKKIGLWLIGFFIALVIISVAAGIIQAIFWLSGQFESNIIFWIVIIGICSLFGTLFYLWFKEGPERKEESEETETKEE